MLDSGFQSPGFRIPKPRIPDPTGKKFVDSGIRILLHGAINCNVNQQKQLLVFFFLLLSFSFFTPVPSTIHPLQNKTITEGGNLNLSCNASGTPPPVVSWVRISTSQRFDGSVSQLININRSEASDYRCEASNECGNASEAQNIDVQCK